MESVVDKLEALVQKADSDLNYVALRLDSQFARDFSKNGEDQLNPIKLLERIRKAKEGLRALGTEATELHSQQKEVVSSVVECLVPQQHLLNWIQHQAGTQLLDKERILLALTNDLQWENIVSEKTEEEELLLGAFNISVGKKMNTSEVGKILRNSEYLPSCDQEGMEQDKENARSCSSNLPIIDNADTGQEISVLRKSLKEFLAVTEEEFDSVSTLVKGRVKLDAVNKVHKVLYDHFKTNKKSPPLTVSDMASMGLKIAGATGQAKLKVLRSLKIIQITNKGAVKWQC